MQQEEKREEAKEGQKSGRIGKGGAEREYGAIHGHANRGAKPSKSRLRHGGGDVQVDVRRKGIVLLRREEGMEWATRNY